MTDPGLIGGNNAHAGTRARPAQQLDPRGALRRDLTAVLALLEATSPVALVMLGRKRRNRVGHALEAARREVRRALGRALEFKSIGNQTGSGRPGNFWPP